MPVRYVGRVTYERGKPLYEILTRLKHFGVGRMVYRNREMTQYAEPSYYIIKSVQPDLSQPLDSRDHRVTVHKYFRGEYMGEIKTGNSYKPDWRLVPRDKEEELLSYISAEPRPTPIVPDAIKFPPLLEKMIIEEKIRTGEKLSEPPLLPINIRVGEFNRAMLEKEARQLEQLS